jgi:putative transcriptional regulator
MPSAKAPARAIRRSRVLKSKAKKATKSTPFGRSLVEEMRMVAAHIRGDITLPSVPVYRPDVKAIRESRGLSQAAFARKYGFNVRTLQDWELGRARPPFAMSSYLCVIEREPDAVERALAPYA